MTTRLTKRRGFRAIGTGIAVTATLSLLTFGITMPANAEAFAAQRVAEAPSPQQDGDGTDPATTEPSAPEPTDELPQPDEAPPEPDVSDPENPDDNNMHDPSTTEDGVDTGGTDSDEGNADEGNADGEDETAWGPQSMELAVPEVAAAMTWGERRNVRLSGADRYATAAAVSKQTFPATADTVIVATGADFPDSLSAAALAAKLKAPLLLTLAGSIPAPTANELTRLKPKRIIVIGGTVVISNTVVASLKRKSQQVIRVAGQDRYATSAAVAKYGWKTSAQAFIATGENYADALAAGAAAGKLQAPVLLVPGSRTAAPAVTLTELTRLGVTKVRIAGGTAAVSSGMASAVAKGRTVTRYGGANRFETAALIAQGVFTGTADTYWANGMGFPDALTGAAAAGVRGGALLLVHEQCVPSDVYSANDQLTPGVSYVLGGTAVLQSSIMYGNECMTRPSGVSNADWSGMLRLYARINQSRYERKLGALRVADSFQGSPAQAWAKQAVSGAAKRQGDLASAQPWVRYQSIAVTDASGGVTKRADRALAIMQSNGDTARYIYQPNGGARGYVSVGYATKGAQSAVVIFVGAGLG